MKRKNAYYSISAVAKMFSIHQQTIRLYEKEGLLCPKRSEGNTRLFSEEDVDRLEEIIYLTHQLGINLAGVEMIFKLQKQIKKLQKDMNKVLDAAQHELQQEAETTKRSAKASAHQLLQLKQHTKQLDVEQNNGEHTASITARQEHPYTGGSVETWDIEYD